MLFLTSPNELLDFNKTRAFYIFLKSAKSYFLAFVPPRPTDERSGRFILPRDKVCDVCSGTHETRERTSLSPPAWKIRRIRFPIREWTALNKCLPWMNTYLAQNANKTVDTKRAIKTSLTISKLRQQKEKEAVICVLLKTILSSRTRTSLLLTKIWVDRKEHKKTSIGRSKETLRQQSTCWRLVSPATVD